MPEFVVTAGHRAEEVLALYEPVLCSSMFRRGARALPAAAVYVGALATIVPHLVFGQGALARYYFLPYLLLVLALLLALPGAIAGKRREEAPAEPPTAPA